MRMRNKVITIGIILISVVLLWLAFCSYKSLIKHQAYSNVRILHSMLYEYIDEQIVIKKNNMNKKLPNPIEISFDENILPFSRKNENGKAVDEWGNEYRILVFLYGNILYVSIRSSGEDSVFYTDDDIFYQTVQLTDSQYLYRVKSISDIERFPQILDSLHK